MSVLLLDSNLIINSLRPADTVARAFIATRTTCCSVISRVEALGYWKITEPERVALTRFFAITTQLPVTDAIIGQAVTLRQSRSMSLGDSLIAATALVHGLELATRNVTDFEWIAGLAVVDPYAR